MAFDMYLGDRREKVEDHEEYIFTMAAAEPVKFPHLNSIWAQFYSSFDVDSEQANALVHELLELHETNATGSGKAFPVVVLRLAEFFSAAVRAKAKVKCHGD